MFSENRSFQHLHSLLTSQLFRFNGHSESFDQQKIPMEIILFTTDKNRFVECEEIFSSDLID